MDGAVATDEGPVGPGSMPLTRLAARGEGDDVTYPVTETRGLDQATAAARFAADGPNRVAAAATTPLAYRILRQLTDPFVVLLLAAAVVTALLRDATDTAVIAIVIVVNAAIGVTQEIRADRAIAALQRLGAPTARVVRDGTDRLIPAAELVRGDLVVVSAGDVVPADLTLVEARQAQIDESMLTGESLPVSRTVGDEAHSGTVVLTGRAEGVVVRTGAGSALGRVAALVATARSGSTPLQRRMTRLGRVLGAVVVALSAIVMLLGVLAGQPLHRMAITAVSLVVAAVPESLPAVVTLALALGAYRMAHGNAIARRLHAVETLGSVTVIASDKTGTLTEGRMSVEGAVTRDGRRWRARGRGYEPAGQVLADDGRSGDDAPLLELARAAVLCNDAHLAAPTSHHPKWTAVGDPLEAALLAFAARCGVDAQAERTNAPRVGEQPFDPATRRMVTYHSVAGGILVVCKGAPESVLTPDVVNAPTEVIADALDAAQTLAGAGLRVLAFAAGIRDRVPDGDAIARLRPLGLVAIGDPIREGAAEVARPDPVGKSAHPRPARRRARRRTGLAQRHDPPAAVATGVGPRRWPGPRRTRRRRLHRRLCARRRAGRRPRRRTVAVRRVRRARPSAARRRPCRTRAAPARRSAQSGARRRNRRVDRSADRRRGLGPAAGPARHPASDYHRAGRVRRDRHAARRGTRRHTWRRANRGMETRPQVITGRDVRPCRRPGVDLDPGLDEAARHRGGTDPMTPRNGDHS